MTKLSFRPEAIVQCFNGDEEAMTDAEKKASELAGRLLMWLQTETAEAPPVMRMDFMVQVIANVIRLLPSQS